MLLVFKNQWGMIFFTYFCSKYYFLGLFNWIRIETHFLLVSQFFYKLSARSFRDRSRLIVEPWGAHALTWAKEGTCPLSTTLCYQFLKKLNNKFKMLSDVPFCFNFIIMSLCHNLSNTLKIVIHLMIYSILFMQRGTKY